MKESTNSPKQKFALAALCGLFVSAFIWSAVLRVSAPEARALVDSIGGPSNIIAQVNQQSKTLKENATQPVLVAIVTLLTNLLGFITDKLAYDAAMYIASGGKGQGPLYEHRSAEEYWKDVGEDIGGEAMATISDGLGQIGLDFNVCAPNNPEVLLGLQMSIKAMYKTEEPRCEWQNIKTNWQAFTERAKESADPNSFILGAMRRQFNPSQNDFGAFVAVLNKTSEKAEKEQILKTAEIIQNRIKSKTDTVTNFITTPASFIQADIQKKLIEKQADKANEQSKTLFAIQDAFLGVGLGAANVFINTLLSQLTQKLYSGLFSPQQVERNPFDVELVDVGGREAAATRFGSMLTAQPLTVSNYSIMNEFLSCASTDNRGLNNCVMDSSFATAVARGRTGAPMTLTQAIDAGLLNGGWPLIPPSDVAKNTDPLCYTYGYCDSNLVKMRKSRIIPIGWEIAAESPANRQEDPVTLREAMEAFNDCNDEGRLDANNPWCHLVDPSWVLKYPENQCRALVFGQVLEAGNSDIREQTCVDAPSCIDEDGNGNCTGGYGYCTREKNIWRFRGDSCPAQYATCLSFTDTSSNKKSDYLLNTVDFSVCSADNAGCRWYQRNKVALADGFDWRPVADLATEDSNIASGSDLRGTFEDRIYFNRNARTCSVTDAGCTEVVKKADSVQLNFVQNSSFETDADNDSKPDNWIVTGANRSTDPDDSRFGTAGANLSASGASQANIVIGPSRFYSFSFYARSGVAGTAQASANLSFVSEDGSITPDITGTSFGGDCLIGSTNNTITTSKTVSGEFERVACTFTSPTYSSDPSTKTRMRINLSGTGVVIDGVQLEQGELVSSFREGYGNEPQKAYMKIAPDYLGCDGGADDPSECANYAKTCTASDIGCTKYTPTNGDPAVTAVVSSIDYCPAVCSGYDTFRQEPTEFEPAGVFPMFFIPSTAASCSAENVGCDEFTNLATEEREYFSDLRACATPALAGNNAGVFYSWEGSDTSGYRLQTWTFLMNSDSSPCVKWSAGSSGVVCSEATAGITESATNTTYITSDATCREHDDIFEDPDCRELYDQTGVIHYRRFSQLVDITASCSQYRKTDVVGSTAALRSGTCTASGGYFDATSGECRYFVNVSGSKICPASANGCREYTGGTSRNSRVAFNEIFESGVLENWVSTSATISNESTATGGHSVHVSALGEIETLYLSESNGNGTCTTGESCELCTTGESCELSSSSAKCQTIGTDGNDACGPLVGNLGSNKVYFVSFWARGNGDLSAYLATDGGSGTEIAFDDVDSVALSPDWKSYRLGPLNTAGDSVDDSAVIRFRGTGEYYLDNIMLREGEENLTLIKNSWSTPTQCDQTNEGVASPQYHLGCQEYRTGALGAVYLKSFTKLCSEDKVGCAPFFKTQNTTETGAKIYNATCNKVIVQTAPTDCSIDFGSGARTVCTVGVGRSSCRFTYDGNVPINSSAPAQLPNGMVLGPEAVVSPADEDMFLVETESAKCSKGGAGCTELGNPTFSQDKKSVASLESAFIYNLPNEYSTTLCEADALFCKEFTTTADGNYYFKDPEDKSCEYKTDAVIDGVKYNGWFRKGTNSPCYFIDANNNGKYDRTGDSAYLIGGNFFGIWRNGDASGSAPYAYDGWAGACAAQYDRCTEFADPQDTKNGAQPEGEKYAFIKNDRISEADLDPAQQCQGQVSQKGGCALFNDSAVPELKWNASASYIKSERADKLYGEAPFSLVNPVSCVNAGDGVVRAADSKTYALCESRCKYTSPRPAGTVGVFSNLPVNFDVSGTANNVAYGGACISASDCQPFEDGFGNAMEGQCVTSNSAAVSAEVLLDVDAGLLSNDTNTVLKVNRDRTCAEWLTCSSSIMSFDSRTRKFKEVCDKIDLCNAYGEEGQGAQCTSWVEGDAKILDRFEYASRNVGWYGYEYSGMSIPNQIPVQFYDQVDINEGKEVCSSNSNIVCYSDADCVGAGTCTGPDAPQDMRLAHIAGSCALANGETCTIGRCESSGTACSSSGECGTLSDGITQDICALGTCQYKPSSPALCASDAQCTTAPYSKCIGGECVDQTQLACFSVSGCTGGSNAECAPLTETKTGACYNNRCLLGIDGTPFNASTGVSTESECRAYPEVNSPFPTSVVTRWKDPDETDPTQKEADTIGQILTVESSDNPPENQPAEWRPYSSIFGFQSVQTCAPGEVCECSYTKAGYGDQSVFTRYFGLGANVSSGLPGICQGGPRGNAWCQADTDCSDDDSKGTCQKLTRLDSLLGWPGYCIERDDSVQINGNRDADACLTWFPIDQLSGSTDLNNKFTEAGFSTENEAYCTEVGVYADLYVTNTEYNESTDKREIESVACAESRGGLTNCTEGQRDDCEENVRCPKGYFGIVGKCKESNLPNDCTEQGDADDDCPYICVPENSVNSSGESCAEPNLNTVGLYEVQPSVYDYDQLIDNIYQPWSPTVYLAESGLSNYIDDYETCVRKGVDLTSIFPVGDSPNVDIISEYIPVLPSSYDEGTYGFRDLINKAAIYPGCKNIAFTSVKDTGLSGGSDLGNKAWTDRLLFEQGGFELKDIFANIANEINYTPTTIVTPAGKIAQSFVLDDANLKLQAEADQSPIVVAYQKSASGEYTPANPGDSNADNYARSYEDFSFKVNQYKSCSGSEHATCRGDADAVCDMDPGPRCFITCENSSNHCTGSGHKCVDAFVLPQPLPFPADIYTGSMATKYSEFVGGGQFVSVCAYTEDDDGCRNGLNDSDGNVDKTYKQAWDLDTGHEYLLEFAGECDAVNNSSFENLVQRPCSVDQVCKDQLPRCENRVCTNLFTTVSEPPLLPSNLTTGSNISVTKPLSISYLEQLFAKVFSFWGFVDDTSDTGAYTNIGDDRDSVDISSNQSATGATAPTIRSLDQCVGDKCTEGRDNTFSVNGAPAGNVTADYGRAHVSTQFFVEANPNQMPIKNVVVDWGDGADYGTAGWLENPSGSTTDDNYYKNHRGLIDIDESQTYCDNESNWGETDKACDPTYITFTHTYRCTDGMIMALNSHGRTCVTDADGNLTNAPCTG
ncbi:TPA: hypothetical protein DCZ32_01640, partial [Candidatus Uhrbacteria bacterium]|nr:hypothetical protein [Candidatus Uhrbacteria bacterium]